MCEALVQTKQTTQTIHPLNITFMSTMQPPSN